MTMRPHEHYEIYGTYGHGITGNYAYADKELERQAS